MKKFWRSRALRVGGLVGVTLGLGWFGPPAMKRVLHLCSLRPDGIREAVAIPTFSRKYGTSCTTCHSPVPIKLNNFGEAFKNNAFRMPADDEGLTKRDDVELGAEAWKKLWPREIFPGKMPGDVPLSWQIYLDARYDPKDETKVDKAGQQVKKSREFNWDVPHELEIMTAGTLGRHMSFWGNVEFKVRRAESLGGGATGQKDTAVDFVQVYGQFDHLFNTSLVNIRVGRFEPRAVPFSRISRRAIAEDFLTSGHALKNGFSLKAMQGGAELWGAKSVEATGGGVTYAAGLVNGDGLTNNDDNNAHQDVYGRLAYKFGGMGVAESLAGSPRLNISGNWNDDSVRVGAYAYKGWAGSSALPFRTAGADLDVWFKNLNLYGTVWKGWEETSVTTPRESEAQAYQIGADYIVTPWLMGVVRYGLAEREGTGNKRQIIPAVVVGIRPNVTWTTEAHLYGDGATAGTKSGDEMVRSRLRFIF